MSSASAMSSSSNSNIQNNSNNPRHEEGKYSDNKYLPNVPRATTPLLNDTTSNDQFGAKEMDDADTNDTHYIDEQYRNNERGERGSERGGERNSNSNSNDVREKENHRETNMRDSNARDHSRDSRRDAKYVTSSAGAALHDTIGLSAPIDMVDPMGMPTSYAKNIAFPNLKSEGLTETHHGLGSNKTNGRSKNGRQRNDGRFSVGTSFMPQGKASKKKNSFFENCF